MRIGCCCFISLFRCLFVVVVSLFISCLFV